MKQTAQGLAALGRGPDTQLVHMAPSEVAGLQALAMKHGGSLTINPDTGLPEAGFLSSILPMVIGAGLVASGVGAPMAAMMVGGGTALATGSLQKGLMAGLGAYGGAGLASGLAAAAPAAATEVAAGSIVPQAQSLAEIGASSAQAAGAGSPTLLSAAQQANTGLGSGFGEMFNPGATSAIYPTPHTQPMYLSQAGLTATPPPQIAIGATPTPTFARMGAGLQDVLSSAPKALEFAGQNAMPLGAAGISALAGMQPDDLNAPEASKGMIRPYTYSREKVPGAFEDVAGAPMSSKERRYFTDQYTAGTPYAAPGPEYRTMAAGGPVEDMSNANAIGANTGYPQADIRTSAYSTPFQQPAQQNMVIGAQNIAVDPYTGQEQRTAPAPQAQFADGGLMALAQGGVSNLGGYSDGGRLLRGPGDGVSDSIPAMIGQKQQARLADGEFVVPARIVSELGNGSTEAGARQLYAMMDRVQKARKKSIGKDKVATNSRAAKLLPA